MSSLKDMTSKVRQIIESAEPIILPRFKQEVERPILSDADAQRIAYMVAEKLAKPTKEPK